MAKCRGCGGDTREFQGGPGWMHYRCEIERLKNLFEETQVMVEVSDQLIMKRLNVKQEDLMQYINDFVSESSQENEQCDKV